MRNLILLTTGLLAFAGVAFGVYAPIPEQEQGKALSFTLQSGVAYDNNIFGSWDNKRDSVMFQNTLSSKFNASVTERTLFSSMYKVQQQYIERRPNKRDLYNHTVRLQVDHTLSPRTKMRVDNTFSVFDNPPSTLPTNLPRANQSFKQNVFNGRVTHDITERLSGVATYRHTLSEYRESQMANDLDRKENAFGIEGRYKFLPEVTLASEVRHTLVDYNVNNRLGQPRKDSTTTAYLVGADYDYTKNTSLKTRFGISRRRNDDPNRPTANRGYFEGSLTYKYGKSSFVTPSLSFSRREASSLTQFAYSEVTSVGVLWQHAITPMLLLSSNATYEDATLRARRPTRVNDLDEQTFRLGTALIYRPNKNWSLVADWDYDNVRNNSAADTARRNQRNRVGISAMYQF